MGKFHSPKITDVKANGQNVLLESYIKIIPCRKVTIKRVAKNGKVLSTQQKENIGEEVIMPISQQEIIMGKVEDVYFADNTDLETQSLFSSSEETFNSRISVKFPFIENQAHYKRLLKQKEPTNFKSSSKNIDVDVSFEIAKYVQQHQEKSIPDEHLDEDNVETDDTVNGEDGVPELSPLSPKQHSQDIQVNEVEENTNNNALTSEVPALESKDLDTTKSSEDPNKIQTTRRSSRRATSEKYNLALQSLKPKISKPEKNKPEPANVSENEKEKDIAEEMVAEEIEEFTYEVKKEDIGILDKKTVVKESTIEMSVDDNADNSSKTSPLSIDEEINIVKKTTEDPKKILPEKEHAYICTRAKKHQRVVPKIKVEEETNESKRRKVIVKADGTTVLSDMENDSSDQNKSVEKEKDEEINPEDVDMEDIFAGLNEEESDEEFVLDEADKSKYSPQTKSPFATLNNTCSICSAVLAPGGVYKHMKLHKKKGAEKFACPICLKVFPSEVKLKLHDSTHQNQNSDGKFECEKCNKTYSTKSSLFKHRKTGSCATEFQCSICCVCFSSERSIEKHNNHFHTEKCLGNFKCKFCNKGFVTKGGLSRHLALKLCHTNLSCHICKKTFIKSGSFKSHMLKHQEASRKTFQCDLCGNFLGSYQSLQKHVSRHLNIRNHACKICNKKFLDVTEVNVHMKSHSQEKPYMCDMCPQRFGQSGHMLRHKLQVHKIGKYPFVCETCGKGFVDRRNIIMHNNMHEKRAKRQLEKPMRKKKVKVCKEQPEIREIKLEPTTSEEVTNVIQIDSSYDITELLGAHVTQTNSDGSQTIISTGSNLQSIEHLLQAANEDNSTVEYISTEEIPMDQNYSEHHQTNYVNIDGIKVENQMINNENIVYTIEDGGHIESIPASDLGILAETAQQFQNNEEHVTYYIIKKD